MAGLFTVMRALDNGMTLGRLAGGKLPEEHLTYEREQVEMVRLDRHQQRLQRSGRRALDSTAVVAQQLIEDPHSWYLVDGSGWSGDWVCLRRLG